MKRRYQKQDARCGAALLIVLFIVMTITVLSLGFMSRCDTELACGQNMLLHKQIDSLAYSGLEQAKGFLLYPQDVTVGPSGYWQGKSGLQLVTPGNDYYDVTVAIHTAADTDPTYRCTYDVNCEAYRLTSGTKVGRSSIKGELRLDPCIAYRVETGISIPSRMAINGDVYCNGSLSNLGLINGDVFASALSGSASGQTKALSDTSVAWPNVTVADFTSKYSTLTIPAMGMAGRYGPYTPTKVCYRNGTVAMGGNIDIEGMLVVHGDLQVSGIGNLINAGKNLPALYVTGDVIIYDSADLTVNGLAVIDGRVRISASAGNVNVYGGLFTKSGLFETAADSSNSIPAYLYNGPTWRSAGQVNGALEFDGVDDYLRTDDSLSNLRLTNDYTFSVWVKADASQKDWAAIFSKTDPVGSDNNWTLQFNSSKNLIIYHPGNNNYSLWDTGIKLTDIQGAWHQIRVVRSGNTMKAYLDSGATPKATGSLTVGPGSGPGHLNIGVDRTGLSDHVFKGLIDELAIYNQAATGANDIPAGLIGSWSFDKSGTGKVNIYAAPANTAVIVWSGGNATRWGQAGGAFFRTIKRN